MFFKNLEKFKIGQLYNFLYNKMYKGLLKDLLNIYLYFLLIWINLYNIYEVVSNMHYINALILLLIEYKINIILSFKNEVFIWKKPRGHPVKNDLKKCF